MNKNRLRQRILPAVIALICILAFQPSSTGAGGAQANQSAPRYNYTDRLIVKYRNPDMVRAAIAGRYHADLTVHDHVRKLSAVAGLELKHFRFMSSDAHVLQLPHRMTLTDAAVIARNLKNDPGVEYAEPDRRMFPMLIPNDPQYSNQWHYKSPTADGEPGGVNLPGAWDITTGSSSVIVAVIDTGILFNHADIAERTVAGYDFVSNVTMANDGDGWDSDPSDPGDWCTVAEQNNFNSPCYDSSCAPRCNSQVNSSWHGTHIAGTIGAATNNSIGVAGINWTSKILPVRVMGKGGGYTSDIADGMAWAVGLPVTGVPTTNSNPAKVLNLSFGDSGPCSPTLQTAINRALTAGTVVVVAAGNESMDVAESNPANCSGVITVAATTRTGARASYSNYGSIVKIAAPGGRTTTTTNGVLSALNSGTTTPVASPGGDIYQYYQGTSMAAPHVAGIASLILSVNPDLTPVQVLSRIQSTARTFPTGTGSDCTTSLCGSGIIDATAVVTGADIALSMTASPNPAVASNNLSYVITAHNNGPGSALSVTVSDTLPDGFTLVSASPSQGTCSTAGGSIICSLGTISNSAQASVTIIATPSIAGTINNTATVTIATRDPDYSNNTATVSSQINNPVPAISSLNPWAAAAGGTVFTLTVNGSNFVTDSQIHWNGSNRTTSFISSAQLTTQITASDIASAVTVPVTVVNPSPGGGTSVYVNFTVNNPAPLISSLNPSTATAGGTAFILTVNGSNFVGTSQIQWNGNNRTTSFISSTQLTTQIAAADIITAGTALVTVVNPSPGGGISTAVSFAINASPAPSGGGGGGGCFIATAAFGSPLEKHVLILRTFRDDYLLHCAAGKTFIDWYYKVSPPVAKIISQSESLRAITRLCLMPIIAIAYPFVAWGIIPTLFLTIIIIGIFCLLIWKLYKKTKISKRIERAAET